MHKLFDLAREFGPKLGPVTAHLNRAGIHPVEWDARFGNHSYGDDAHALLAQLAGDPAPNVANLPHSDKSSDAKDTESTEPGVAHIAGAEVGTTYRGHA